MAHFTGLEPLLGSQLDAKAEGQVEVLASTVY
jgi:hypothetical protein